VLGAGLEFFPLAGDPKVSLTQTTFVTTGIYLQKKKKEEEEEEEEERRVVMLSLRMHLGSLFAEAECVHG